jgi:hypothetical protein
MRKHILATVKDMNEESFAAKAGEAAITLEKGNKVWTDFKVKKVIADTVGELIVSEAWAATYKINCIKLLNVCITKRNKDFNLYVLQELMPLLVKYAQYNNNKEEAPSARELLTRGVGIFGQAETD